jgi:hypothetical protein
LKDSENFPYHIRIKSHVSEKSTDKNDLLP